MSLDSDTIRDLLEFDDEDGVLSFYVGHTPAQAADPQPTAPIEIRNQIKALKVDLSERDGRIARRVEDRIGRIGGELDRLLDPHAHGRGRALFVGVSSGRTETVAVQIPFTERVIHHDGAYVRPLVAAQDEGRPAGIVNISHDGARVLDWAVGEVTEVATHRFEVEDDVMARGKAGPSVGNVAHPWQGRADRDAFIDRLDENRHRFVKALLDELVETARARGWDRIVVAGAAKMRDEAAASLRDSLDGSARVLVAEQNLEDAAAHVIAEQSWGLLRSVHRDREAELVETAVERGLGGNAGAVGLRRVCEALNEGRVQHLLFTGDLELEGYRSDEDTLHPRVEGAIAQSDQVELHREPLFVERMIEKAVATAAAVTPVDPQVAGPLGEHEGVAALLRW